MSGFTPVLAYESTSGTGGGGGGSTTTMAWNTMQFNQTAAFSSGLVLTLAHTPGDPDSVTVDYNGIVLRKDVSYTVSGTTVTILFSDDPTTYDGATVYFQISYEYVP